MRKRRISLIKLEKTHIKSASLMLTRAFKDDDMKEVFPDAEEASRLRVLESSCRFRAQDRRAAADCNSPPK